ncbi:zinc finger CCHC domain-containing protein 9 isoform X2 [Clarias gariepinus]|uniref:zinc finger CCHC domain-containing protein 9 isoform X2 n=1 Tax=Clarias gariepinus TaxID=13013 RepID=UPI00234C6AB4|nr:zinc finger CCHC domain-containing protein 9 isoform X2 [Clarias gariepinus]
MRRWPRYLRHVTTVSPVRQIIVGAVKTALPSASSFYDSKIMTRWARAKNSHKQKSTDATSWAQQRAGIAGRGQPSNSLDASHHRYPDEKGAHKNRQLHVNEFTDYMENMRQALPKGQRRRAPEELDMREVVDTALKKNKRRENRRLKRQNATKSKMVCFNCRKPGHGLADCPKADDVEMGRGICFRCGSTEHDIQKCRAKVDPAMGDYPYAKCFICGKAGHLSKSCPDNPKGLYAAGGCCRICGSVEHFQKDCPDHQTSKHRSNGVTWRRSKSTQCRLYSTCVSQGSVLGPLLFSRYTWSLVKNQQQDRHVVRGSIKINLLYLHNPYYHRN